MHHQLEALVEVVRRGSVTGAAQALYVTQPALTARLNALERDVGTRLLVRRRGGVRLTEAGRAFLPTPSARCRRWTKDDSCSASCVAACPVTSRCARLRSSRRTR